jgi:hypothetical protein
LQVTVKLRVYRIEVCRALLADELEADVVALPVEVAVVGGGGFYLGRVLY